jgi:hypothetical protein
MSGINTNALLQGSMVSPFLSTEQLLAPAKQNALLEHYAVQNRQSEQTMAANEIEYAARAAQGLLGLGDEAAMAAAYPGAVATAQQYGFLKKAPSVFPGKARLEQIAAMGTPAKDQAEQAAVRQTATGLRIPMPGATPATAAPGATTGAVPGAGGGASFAGGIAGMEGGGNAMPPENPRWPVARGGPAGAHQFIASTWNEFAKANPELFKGMTPEQVLAARNDTTVVGPNGETRSTLAANWYAGENAKVLQAQNIAPTPANLGIAHALGAGGATKVLSAPDNTPLSQVIPETIAQNPQYGRMTVGDLKRQYSRLGPVGGPGDGTTPPPYQVATTGAVPPPPVAAPGAVAPVAAPGTATTAQPPPGGATAPAVAMPTPPTPLVGDTGLTASQIKEYNNRISLARTAPQLAQAEAWKEQLVQHNATVQQQYETRVQQAQQHAQTQANEADRRRISQRQLELSEDANRRANDELAEKARVAGETYVPGTGIEAVHENTVQKYAAKIAKGQQLTDDEQRLYDGAYYALQQTGGQTGVMTDPNNPGQQIPFQTTRRLSPSLPEPKGGALPAVISQPGAPTRAAATEGQGKAAGWADRMQIAAPVMDKLDDVTTYAQRGLEKAGKYVGYNVNTPEYQQLRTAQEAFLGAILRKESGAAISPAEWERDAHLYFPMPGESVETAALKKRFRQAAVEGMIREAGPGYKPAASTTAPTTGGWSVKRID